MGILSDPTLSSSGKKSKYMTLLSRYTTSFCIFWYFIGVIWFSALALKELQSRTYFSENALLPGLVLSEIKMDSVNLARNLLQELEHERTTHKTGMPYPWLHAKMKQIGLETYMHNFTLNFPFGGGKTFEGRNIYGILRAPRISSTEAIIISMPYRPPNTAHTSITPSVPLLLAFADFARRQKYWSKDLIFLVTDQEQLGMQAFLEAYFGEDGSNILNSGKLFGKAGNILAAINFEVQDFDVDFNNLKIEGLNGQLPNLDLHNLVVKLSHKQGVATGYKMKASEQNPDDIYINFMNILSMMWTQSSGIPNGNHGLFHRYGIESLTIECVKRESSVPNQNPQQKIMALLKIVEGITRSLNNLLERFHQSFFFYVIISSEKFISIGDYMPSIGLMTGSVFIKAFLLWLISNTKDEEVENSQKEDEKIMIVKKSVRGGSVLNVGTVFLIAHLIGFGALFIMTNKAIHDSFHSMNIPTQTGIFYLVVLVFIISLSTSKLRLNTPDSQLLNITILLEIGATLLAVSMLNFALGFFLSVTIVPFAIFMNVNASGSKNLFKFLFKSFIHLAFHPLVLIYVVVLMMTCSSFPELSLKNIIDKSFKATVDGITYGVVDSLIYGNWLFDLTCLVLLPCWIVMWILNFSKPATNQKLHKD